EPVRSGEVRRVLESARAPFTDALFGPAQLLQGGEHDPGLRCQGIRAVELQTDETGAATHFGLEVEVPLDHVAGGPANVPRRSAIDCAAYLARGVVTQGGSKAVADLRGAGERPVTPREGQDVLP